MKNLKLKTFTQQGDKNMQTFIRHVQAKLLSKLAMTCLLITASWLTFIGCAPEAMNPVAKKAGDGTPTPPALVGPIYLAVGNDGKIALSKDSGVSWEAVDSGLGLTTRGLDLLDIATDGTNIVAVVNDGTVVRSTDGGESWSIVSSTGISSSGAIEIEYGNGVFSIFTYKAIAPHYEFHRSTDGGATWAKGTIASGLFTFADAATRLAYNGSRFLAVGGLSVSGDGGTIAVSTDGLAYTSGLGNGDVKLGTEVLGLSIANGRFFIFNKFTDGYDTPNIYQSPTGDSQWTTNRRTSGTDVTTFPAAASGMSIKDVAHAGSGGVYAFVGNIGANIMTSATAMAGSFTVTTLPIGSRDALSRIIFFNGKFVVAGGSGAILTSDAMGVTWTAATSGTTANLTIGEATANKIIFAGANGKIVVSSDGTTWEEKSVATITTPYRRLVLIE